jgi:hypothetical protein
LLEAIYFKRFIVVGSAPSLKEIVPPSGGRFVQSEADLRDALRTIDAGEAPDADAGEILTERTPDRIAAKFAAVFGSFER